MANKKINQLVAKTTIQSTDLFPLGDPTTGQLFKKTVAELQAAIGGAVISVNGLTGVVVLDTDDVQELASPTNRYFTEARARAAISLTTTGSSGASTYSSSTGVLNVPTYTLAGLGGISASFLSGGTGITYNSSTGVISYSGTVYTDASVRGLISAGTGLSYNSSTGVFSYSGTVYTDSSIRALISLTTNGSSGAATYNNTTGVINVPNYTLAGLGGISLTSLSGSAPITYNSSTGAIGITQATTSTNGYLSATDWNTFNGKQSALTLGNVTESVSNVLMFPDGGTNKTIGNLSIQVVQAGSTSSGYLSTTDWNTFNNKQNAITLTTTGTSGAATFSGGTLNIPQYQGVLTNPVTGTGTTNYIPKWTSSSALGNSSIFDNGTGVGIATASPNTQLQINGTPSTDWGNLTLQDTRTQAINQGGMIAFAGYKTSTTAAAIFAQIKGNKENSTSGNEAGYLSFLTNNNTTYIERMRITSGGGVQFKPSTSDSIEIFYNATTSTGAMSSDADNFIIGGQTGKGMIFCTNNLGQEKMRITTLGLVGLGTTTPAHKLDIANAGGVSLRLNNTSSSADSFIQYDNTATNFSVGVGSNGWFFYTGQTKRYDFWIANNIALQLASSQNLLIGTTTDNGERLYVSGSIRATGSITANSDARLKKNIERIENALEKVEQISGYTYNTIYDEDRHAGVIAQEIDKVLPEIVNKGNDGLMGVEYGNISALLIEAIKDLKTQNDSLQARLSALEK